MALLNHLACGIDSNSTPSRSTDTVQLAGPKVVQRLPWTSQSPINTQLTLIEAVGLIVPTVVYGVSRKDCIDVRSGQLGNCLCRSVVRLRCYTSDVRGIVRSNKGTVISSGSCDKMLICYVLIKDWLLTNSYCLLQLQL